MEFIRLDGAKPAYLRDSAIVKVVFEQTRKRELTRATLYGASASGRASPVRQGTVSHDEGLEFLLNLVCGVTGEAGQGVQGGDHPLTPKTKTARTR
ncbi:MAG TPA: hypothetical protein VFD58_04305 [Blastocatellia bacterium]|nr:hypothetical protein [Blastocatellia bacterium]